MSEKLGYTCARTDEGGSIAMSSSGSQWCYRHALSQPAAVFHPAVFCGTGKTR